MQTIVVLLPVVLCAVHVGVYLAIARHRGSVGWLDWVPFLACIADDGSGGVSRRRRAAALGAASVAQYAGVALVAAWLFQCSGVDTGTTRWAIAGVAPTSDARGKLEVGDTILSIDGQVVYYVRDGRIARPSLAQLVSGNAGRQVKVEVSRTGTTLQRAVLVKRFENPRGAPHHGLGITVRPSVVRDEPGIARAVGLGFALPYDHTAAVARSIWDIFFKEEEGKFLGPVGVTDTIKVPTSSSWRASVLRAVGVGAHQWLVFLLLSLAMCVRVWMAPAQTETDSDSAS